VVLNRMLLRRHNGQEDFEIVVPQLLLKQKERTQKMFSSILAAIAGISLLVGGIGIMNIMLASVLERTREIGLRISLGARPADVAMQFLVEATLISLGGGLFGLILGWGLSTVISKSLDVPVSISGYSALVAFGISVGVGLIFGYYPARTASRQDPITSLRYE
jgi:putative ABC transport system permease protein